MNASKIPCKKCGYPVDNKTLCRKCGTYNEDGQ